MRLPTLYRAALSSLSVARASRSTAACSTIWRTSPTAPISRSTARAPAWARCWAPSSHAHGRRRCARSGARSCSASRVTVLAALAGYWLTMADPEWYYTLGGRYGARPHARLLDRSAPQGAVRRRRGGWRRADRLLVVPVRAQLAHRLAVLCTWHRTRRADPAAAGDERPDVWLVLRALCQPRPWLRAWRLADHPWRDGAAGGRLVRRRGPRDRRCIPVPRPEGPAAEPGGARAGAPAWSPWARS